MPLALGSSDITAVYLGSQPVMSIHLGGGEDLLPLPTLPDGFSFLVDDEGTYLVDGSGAYLIVEEVAA